jgi:hypothetical protein
MLRASFLGAILVLTGAIPAPAQVQTVGDVSFAVPDGWRYQPGRDFGAMVLKTDTRFWVVAVYSAMPSSGDANADFRAAWKRVVLAGPDYRGVPNYDPYNLSDSVGYAGKFYDDSSVDQKTYTRLYVLEAGKVCVPVAFVSQNRNVLDGMEHNARAVAGSVRVVPLKASPIKYSINVADLAGHWTTGLINSIDFYNSSGQYQSNSLTAVRSDYTIAADGSFTYKFGGLMNNRVTNDDDSGVVELGGEFVTFKGHKHVTRYRFVNLQQTLDGSTVLTLWPPTDMSQIVASRDSVYWTRKASK